MVSYCLKPQFKEVLRFAVATDRDIDTRGVEDDKLLEGNWVGHQCKHYEGTYAERRMARDRKTDPAQSLRDLVIDSKVLVLFGTLARAVRDAPVSELTKTKLFDAVEHLASEYGLPGFGVQYGALLAIAEDDSQAATALQPFLPSLATLLH